MQTIDNFNFAGKKAFVRVDFNVPLDENFNIIREKDTQLQAAVAEIEKMLAGETADAPEAAATDSPEVATKDAA